jgi:N-acetylmuramoyl-L-alanine amidase
MFHLLSKSCCLFLGLAASVSAISIYPLAVLAQTSANVPNQATTAPINPAPVAKPQVAKKRPLVTIDPGHGGKDPGAIGLGELREVDVILPIALRVGELLTARGVDIQLTRNSDYFVGLDERVVMSRKAKSTIFVSIHANAIDNRPDVHGLETYHYHKGETLAYTVHDKVIEMLGSDPKTPLNNRNVRSARFLVLRKSEIPAILVEVGYLTSPTESLYLADPGYREKMAQAIAAGIIQYLEEEGLLSESEAPAVPAQSNQRQTN